MNSVSETTDRIRELGSRYPDARAAVLPALHAVQEKNGYIPDDAIGLIAQELGVPEADVFGTATFYALLDRAPCGRHKISICRNLSCSLLGAEELIAHLEQKLGVKEGEVTPDGRFSFRRIECIGRCDGAPAMLVDDDYHGELTAEKIDGILKSYE
jgi:NADH-quinone oxidoreductase subunit E